MRTFCLAALLLLLGSALRAAQNEATPLVNVDGHVITAGELERYMAINPDQALLPTPGQDAPGEMADLRRQQMLRALVDRHLMVRAAREAYGTGPGAEERLDAYAEDQLRQFASRVGSRLKAYRVIADMGLSIDEFKQMHVDTLLAMRYLWDKALEPVAVRPAEVRRYYEENREQFRRPRTVVYRQILLTVADEAERTRRRLEAQMLLERLKNGADFALLADEHSDDADRYPGGLHVVRVPDAQPEWRPAAVRGLEPGQLSQVREVGGGLAIVRLEQVAEPRLIPFEEAQPRIRAALLERKRAEAREEFLSRLRQRAHIEYLPASQGIASGA